MYNKTMIIFALIFWSTFRIGFKNNHLKIYILLIKRRYNITMTIYALSSGPGISGLAVIRMQTKIIKLLTGNSRLPKPRVATLKKINKINNNELIDEGIIIMVSWA